MRFFTFLIVALLALGTGTVTTGAQKLKGKKTEKKKDEAPKEAGTVNEVGGKDLKAYVQEISDRDRSKGVAAMKAVLLFGADRARAAIPVILKELKKHQPGIASVDPSFLINAPTTLTMILSGVNSRKFDPKEAKVFAEEVKDTIKALKGLLHDKQVVVSHRAAQALMLFGPMAREALPDLYRAMQTPSYETRQAAVVALSTIAQPIPLPDHLPKEKGAEAKVKAMAALNHSTRDKAISELYKAMRDRAAPVRMSAVSSLQALHASEPADQKANFVKHIEFMAQKDAEPALRIQAHLLLYPNTNKGTPAVLKAAAKRRAIIAGYLDSPVTAVRLQAAQALGRIGSDALEQVPALRSAIDDRDGSVGVMAILSIANIGRKDAETKQYLGNLILKHAKPAVRLEALKAVATLGPDANDLLDTLKKAREDKDEAVSVAAIYALANVGRKDAATKTLLGNWLLTDAKPEIRLEVIKAVAAVGKDADDMIPTLLQAASKDKHKAASKDKDEEVSVQTAAIAAIPHLGQKALQVIPQLQQIAADSGQAREVRDAARMTAEQLTNFKNKAKDPPKKEAAK